MMLVQQSGSGALPLSNLSPAEFLPFFRRIEESVIFHGLSPVIVYWSTRHANWLLPESESFRTLSRDAFCVSIFSEERQEEQDEFCFLVHSQGISIVVHGHCSDESGVERIYQCVGSIDPHLVKRAFQAMIPHWQFIDLPEANKLDDARGQVGNPVTAPHFVNGIRHDWPVIKQRAGGEAGAAAVAAGLDPSVAGGSGVGGRGNAAVLASTASSLQHPQMVVRPGAETFFPQGQPVALDLSAGLGKSPQTPQTPGERSLNLPPPPPGPPPGKLSQLSLGKPVQKPAAKPSPLEQTATARAPAQRGEGDLPSTRKVYGDPSLLEEPFDFQGLTNSPLFRPPDHGAAATANGTAPKAEPAQSAASAARKEASRGMRELREVWTNITQEARTIFAPDAQKVIRDIVVQLRISSDLSAILDLAIEELTKLSRADRGLIWQVVDDQLVVTNEFAQNEHYCFKGANLGAQETTAIVSEFLSRFPDDTGTSTIAIADTNQDAKLRRMSPTLAALIELGDARARLVAQIRSRGIFHGFVELQQAGSPREWTEQDGAVLQSVSEMLSLVVQQSFDLMRIEQDANEMKLVNEISGIFRESGGQRAQYTIEQAIKLFSDHTGFASAQVFLYSEDEGLLVPQISEKEHSESIPLSQKNNPFVKVFESGKLNIINLEYSKRKDLFFGHDTAMIIPLMSEGEKLGVLGLWKRNQGIPMLRPQDRELAFTVAGNLASIIRAEQANAQVRQKGARESLINSVSEQIQQSLKEVNPILFTLVSQLAEYFDLGLAAVSIYDSMAQTFMEPQCAGYHVREENSLLSHLAESLFQSQAATLANPDFLLQPMPALMLDAADVKEALGDMVVDLPENTKITMIFPMRQGNNLKGALCMVSAQEKAPSLPDMRMIQDLLNRVAVVIEHKELFEKVERQAITDGLTGLYNRRYFEEQLAKELDRHQRFKHSCSYIILDLDHFKSVNDTLDHLHGDIALKHTSAIARKCVRDVDTVGRLGGEEFVVLLPESDENAAMVVAERICTTLRESVIEQFKTDDCRSRVQDKLREGKINEATANRLANGRITASIGVATFPRDAEDKTRLMELADKYLYMAKARGRNQVCSFRDDTGVPEAKPAAPAAAGRPSEKPKQAPTVAPARALPVPGGFAPSTSGGSAFSAQIDFQQIAEHGIIGLLGSVVKAVSAKDGYSDDRTPRAADYASRIALNLRLSKEHTTVISLAAILNNLGKCIVDEQVLRKRGPLSPDEWRMVESAPSTAARILEPARHLHRVAIVIESYQEHWDGSGYPRGLKGEDIPLESRIISVVDAFVAMTSNRPYRPALSREAAIQILQKGAGREWDPRIVKLFLAILEKEARS
jgi:diguanylate cyclase (GGDEF)-like protein